MGITINESVNKVVIDESGVNVVSVGTQGPTGATGATGPTGATGADGADGVFSTIASQAEAEAGTNNTNGMTPLRTAQAITELGGGGGVLESQTVTTPVNQIDFTTIPAGGFFEIDFWFEHSLGQIPSMIVNDSISSSVYNYQQNSAYNGGAAPTEDWVELVIKLGYSGGGYEATQGKIIVKRNAIVGTLEPSLNVEVQSIARQGATAGSVNRYGYFLEGITSIEKISFGCYNWFASANASKVVTAGEFKLIKVV